MRVVIVGLAKSGTTAMLCKIASSMDNPLVLMEPKRPWKERSRRESNFGGVVAKLLIGQAATNSVGWSYDDPKPMEIVPLDYTSFDCFEKKIMIVRDPRDIIVSHMLHKAGYHAGSEAGIHRWLDLLMEKEASPQSKSILPLLLPLLDAAYLQHVFDAGVAFPSEHPDYFVVTYEDFISGRIEPLEAYLGMRLVGVSDVGSKWQRVVRTKGSGSWRKWFSLDDVEFFKPMLTPYMVAFGYDLKDWQVGDNRPVPQSEGSDYVKRWLSN